MNLNPVVLSIPIYFLLIGIELLIQAFSKKKMYRLNDAVTNISCGITSQLSGVFFKVLSVGVYMLVYENLRFFTIESTWYSIIVLWLLVDLAYYWAHRMSHEINLFWGGHVVHHQSEDYNFSVALRQSSFQVIWTFAFYLPIALLGFNTIDFVLVSALNTVYQFWIHTETIGKLGILEYVFNTPSHHRVHHGKDPKYIDKNHAGSLIIWDKMFGTFQPEEEKPTYGITQPLNSWNPVWANFAHYATMAKEIRTIKKPMDKVRYLFYKPGWLPEDQGGYRAPRKVEKATYHKYDTANLQSSNFYVLFQYILILIGTAFLLFNLDNFNLNEIAFLSILITISVVNCGALFEQKKWIIFAEEARIVIFGGLGIYLSYTNFWDLPLLITSLVLMAISLIWLQKIRKDYHASQEQYS